MSIHVHIGNCTTPEAIPMLITLYYYYIDLLYWHRQETLKEMDWEQWNNAARCRQQRAHKRSHAQMMNAGSIRIWQRRVMGTHPWCRCLPNVDWQGAWEGREVPRRRQESMPQKGWDGTNHGKRDTGRSSVPVIHGSIPEVPYLATTVEDVQPRNC